MILRRWATRGLRSGDLTALSALTSGGAKPSAACIERLGRRGFMRLDASGKPSITLRGRLALTIRRSM